MYGTQANTSKAGQAAQFENDVNMYGTQAILRARITPLLFENDVNMYGTQAVVFCHDAALCLRMM